MGRDRQHREDHGVDEHGNHASPARCDHNATSRRPLEWMGLRVVAAWWRPDLPPHPFDGVEQLCGVVCRNGDVVTIEDVQDVTRAKAHPQHVALCFGEGRDVDAFDVVGLVRTILRHRSSDAQWRSHCGIAITIVCTRAAGHWRSTHVAT